MPNQLKNWLHFLWAGILNQKQTGGIMPSQRFLIDKMISPIPRDHRGPIIELGAGSGALTLRLAERCPSAQVFTCEINPALAKVNQRNVMAAGAEERVQVIAESAEGFLAELVRQQHPPVAYIVSGVPIGNFGRQRTLTLLRGICGALQEGGMYIQFQHSLLDRKKIRQLFRNVRTTPVFLNFPPAVVYYAQR